MHIRNATYHDAPEIRSLLEALGYKTSISMLVDQLKALFDKEGHEVWVYELRKEVVGFVSVHYLPQLAFDGGFMLISYLSVDETVKDLNIGKALEEYVTGLAKMRKCDRIEVHYSERRVTAHQFYERQGYREYPKYYTKRLVYAE
jgi:GNAT superfamily N-acetyltransferase